MSSKRSRKKQATLQRAAPAYPPGGALLYLSPQQLQSIYGNTFYGNALQNMPVSGTEALFPAGTPLPAQPGVNPGGLPVQWKFPVAYNTFPVDRTLGNPDIPTFEQLRRLAKLYSGITMCERYWLDLVPRMKLNISLRLDLVAQGLEEKDFEKEKTYFLNFFEKPDGFHDTHTWLRLCLREQSQIDELYLYKNRTRGGKFLGLSVVDGTQMKPLLDNWGHIPPPPGYAYQNFPWGIPGFQYSTDQMIHYQETPAVDTPYGFSRVERIILEVNLALKKKRMDLSYYTESNLPAGIMEVPATSNWTPDQIDAFEQSWNALIAGNLQQMARVKFTQPGMKFSPTARPDPNSPYDLFLFNIAVGCYGLSLESFGFTGTSNRSTGQTQENVEYRRTIGPLALMYGAILTHCMQHDFDPSLHGDYFVATFGGYEESEDIQTLATAYSALTNAGILGLTNAGKLLHLPEDPDAPHIGRVFFSKDGPIFLDDMASDKLRNVAAQAKLAGLQLAASAPQQSNGKDTDDDNDDEPETTTQGRAGKPQPPRAHAQPGAAHAGNPGAPSGRASAARAIAAESTDAASSEASGDNNRPVMLEQHTGMMIAFLLKPDAAAQLALPGGEPPQDLHVTLAFLGDKEEIDLDLTTLNRVLSNIAGESTPLMGQTGGLGSFAPSGSSDALAPIIALVNVNGLQAFRAALVSRLAGIGIATASDFEYTPHITLAYVDANAPSPIDSVPSVPLVFDTLCLAIGDDRSFFSFGLPTLPPGDSTSRAISAEYRRWRSRAIEDVKAGKAQRGFTTTIIPSDVHATISAGLARCVSADDVRDVFSRAKDGYSAGPSDSGTWQTGDPTITRAVSDLAAQHVVETEWLASKFACDECLRNDGKRRKLGEPYPTGALLPMQHPHCDCGLRLIYADGTELVTTPAKIGSDV